MSCLDELEKTLQITPTDFNIFNSDITQDNTVNSITTNDDVEQTKCSTSSSFSLLSENEIAEIQQYYNRYYQGFGNLTRILQAIEEDYPKMTHAQCKAASVFCLSLKNRAPMNTIVALYHSLQNSLT